MLSGVIKSEHGRGTDPKDKLFYFFTEFVRRNFRVNRIINTGFTDPGAPSSHPLAATAAQYRQLTSSRSR
jgi:hypothetical protein